MPIYEYHCEACGSHFEMRRPMKEADATGICPECGNEQARRALSRFFASGGASPTSGKSAGGGGCASCSATSCSTCSSH